MVNCGGTMRLCGGQVRFCGGEMKICGASHPRMDGRHGIKVIRGLPPGDNRYEKNAVPYNT